MIEKATTERRRRILEEAIGLVHLADGNGITMRRLAAKVGHSAAAIYLHFDGKQELEREIALHGLGQLEERLTPAFAIPDACEALAGLVRGIVQFGVSHPKLYGLMFQHLPELRTLELAGDSRIARLRAEMLGVYERGIASGAFRRLDPEIAMAVRWAMLHGFVQLVIARRLLDGADGAEVERLREGVVDTVLRSLRS